MLKVYTAQYRYSGPHRLDITVKGNSHVGMVFAPSWALVNAYKKTGDEQTYRDGFHNMMIASLDSHADIWRKNVLKRDIVVLVCFCKAGDFCHRTLVADYLVQLGAKYMGEITNLASKALPIEEEKTYYYYRPESECVWCSNNPDEADMLVEEIDQSTYDRLDAIYYKIWR